jgi:hypothetical protein
MNSMINCSRLLAVALGVAILAGCNAVEDVPDEPTGALPGETAVLGGTIDDLGTRRPLVLQYNGTDTCLVPVNTADPTGRKIISECQYFGIADQKASVFSFGALPVGTPYNITVKRQPFGRICTVQNPTGTVRADAPAIKISCADDPAVPHFTVTVNIAAAARSKAGLKVMLTTEHGTCPVDVNGRSVITFSPSECPDEGTTAYHRNATYLFDNKSSLPVFPWRVTATIPGPNALSERTNCFITNTAPAANPNATPPILPTLVSNTGGNINDSGVAISSPSENIGTKPTNQINVERCGFRVQVQAEYSQSPAEASSASIAPGDFITVALRTQPQGVDVAAANITNFSNTFVPFMVPDANGNPTTTEYEAQSDANAFYELVIKKSPAGMACTPGYSTTSGGASPAHGTRNVGSNVDGGAVLLRRPSSGNVAQLWLPDRMIRCRLIAANPPQGRLRGSYWQYTETTTTREPYLGGAPNVVVATVYNRNILTFFEDGQYIFGNHTGVATTEGIETGFYAFNPGTTAIAALAPGRFVFSGMVDINGGTGLHSGAGVARTLNNAVISPGSPKTITAEATSSGTTTPGLVLGGTGQTLSVTVGTVTNNVGSGTYNTGAPAGGALPLSTLIDRINTAAGSTIAAASGNEIRITGPAGGVTFGGNAVAGLGFPASVAQGATATSTNVFNTLNTRVIVALRYILSEVGPDTRVATTNALDGAWVTWDWQRQPAPVEDRRRVMVYQHGNYNVYHFGINGFPNMQATCLVGDFTLIGTWTRQGSGQGCEMRIPTDTVTNGSAPVRTINPNPPAGALASGDNPNPSSVLRDIPGRWPQSQTPTFTDGRPYSLVDFEVRLAGTQPTDPVCPNLDKLTVWDTINGVHKDTLDPPIPRLVLCRIVAN